MKKTTMSQVKAEAALTQALRELTGEWDDEAICIELPREGNGKMYGIWLGSDLIGHGPTVLDALGAAIAQAVTWLKDA